MEKLVTWLIVLIAVAEAYKQAIVQLQEQTAANFTQSEQTYESAPTMSM